jgi:NADP-dependent 3-hydroxy acid dehydrogenase YdfG
MQGRVIFCAGASSGMGRATARAFASAGADLVLSARNAAALEVLASELSATPGRIVVAPVDATDADAVDGVVARTLKTFGRLDVLVNTVGANIPRRALLQLKPASWADMLAINLTAAFNLSRSVVPAMRQRGEGLFLQVSSTAAKKADGSGAAYQATKAGVAALAYAAMEEERGNGIRFTVIYPGFTDTPLVLQRPVRPTPEMLAHALQPEDIAAACLFVARLPSRAHVPELVIAPSR